jgi:circadian clock protein KaiC
MAMSDRDKAIPPPLTTGIERLDSVLGGGLPEYSLNVIIGEPGSGKTTLAHQIAFANASSARPVLYFAALGEPSLKMLRYQQRFSFYDAAKVGESLHFVSLADAAATEDRAGLIDLILRRLDEHRASLVVLDSFRAMFPSVSPAELQAFNQTLALRLTAYQVTTILVGEYSEEALQDHPIYAIADGVISLRQSVIRNSMVRKLRVCKMRGQDPQPGLHTIRITQDGLQVFPRMLKPLDTAAATPSTRLISTGIEGLDEMLGGGTFEGSSLIVAGPTGSGKTTVGIQFIAEGVRRGEAGVVALFEETVAKYIQQAHGFGVDLQKMIDDKMVELVFYRPLDLSMDETLYSIQSAIQRVGARRVVIDSVTALESALAPSFREDYHESLYRLIGAVTGQAVSILMAVEIATSYAELQFTPHAVSYLTHDIILQRYFELEGRLRTFMSVVKTRGRKHESDLRGYVITNKGIQVGPVLSDFEGIISAVPRRVGVRAEDYPGLTEDERAVLSAVQSAGDTTLDQLRSATHLPSKQVKHALRRLVELAYVKRIAKLSRSVFRARG